MMHSLKDYRVLVTPTSYALHDPTLRTRLEAVVGEVIYNAKGRPLSSAELRELLPGCDGFIAGLDTIDRAAVECADRLKVISRYGVGTDNIDMEAVTERGIVVTNTPGANATSVAELTIGLMLSLGRSIPSANEATKTGKWPRTRGYTLEGKTVGLIGFGSIGKKVAHCLTGFNCTILAHDPIPDKEYAESLNVKLLPLADVLEAADFLSLHLPLVPETVEMVNAEFISQMKAGSWLINTSRGEIIDERALLEALENGHLQGAALDVFATQPPREDHPLFCLTQVIATPHMGSHTDGATNAMGQQALDDCLAVLRGDAPQNSVIPGP